MRMTIAPTNATDTESSRRRARELFRGLIDLFRASGNPVMAQECIDLAVGQGLWLDPAQRPVDYLPGLTARPVHDAARIEACAYLEAHFPKILGDLEAAGEDPFFPVEEQLLSSGSWDEVIFYEGGIRYATAARRFPGIAEVLDGLPASVLTSGVAMLSRLGAGSHIVAHCGQTNRRLRIHLALKVPRDALMRVKDHYVEWQPGRCVLFDDSFEHEVWNFAAEPRLVLLLDVPHPELAERTGPEAAPDLTARIEAFLRARGLVSVEQGSDGRLVFRPDAYHERLAVRLLHEIERTEITSGKKEGSERG